MTHSNIRKLPQQRRSAVTVDAILQASTQLLLSEPYEQITTNRIAERAGVSIGSFYQYFRKKDGIIAALRREHVRDVGAAMAEAWPHAKRCPFPTCVRPMARAVINVHARAPRLHKLLDQDLSEIGKVNSNHFSDRSLETHRIFCEIEAHFEENKTMLPTTNTKFAAISVWNIVASIVHAAIFDGELSIERDTLENDICATVNAYLRVPGDPEIAAPR